MFLRLQAHNIIQTYALVIQAGIRSYYRSIVCSNMLVRPWADMFPLCPSLYPHAYTAAQSHALVRSYIRTSVLLCNRTLVRLKLRTSRRRYDHTVAHVEPLHRNFDSKSGHLTHPGGANLAGQMLPQFPYI